MRWINTALAAGHLLSDKIWQGNREGIFISYSENISKYVYTQRNLIPTHTQTTCFHTFNYPQLKKLNADRYNHGEAHFTQCNIPKISSTVIENSKVVQVIPVKSNGSAVVAPGIGHTVGLAQERRNSSALAMELRLSCTNHWYNLILPSLVPVMTWMSLENPGYYHPCWCPGS